MATIEPRSGHAKTGEHVVIRSAVLDDAAEILECLRAGAATTEQILTAPDEFPKDLDEERAFITKRREDPNSLFLVAVVDGRMVGGIGFEGVNRRRMIHTGTMGMTLLKEWRSRGVGTLMLQTVLDWAAAHPVIEKVCLSVFSSNVEGIGLYRKLGFTEEGRRTGQVRISSGYVDEIFMGTWVKKRK